MRGVPALNGIAFAFAFAASTVAVLLCQPRSPKDASAGGATSAPSSASTTLAELVDRSGVPIPRHDYRHIVSVSPAADEVLLEICEPDRVAAFAGTSARGTARGFRYAGKPTIERLDDIERILSLYPDLVLVNGIGDPRPVARLREAGLVVFDLGEMRGLSTLIPQIHELADVLGHPERGEWFATALVERMNAIAADVPASKRPRGIHLSVYGDSLFGGAIGTSYHDVLVAAGLVDGALAYRGWPQYTAEQVLTMDPDIIVTNTGMRGRLCAHSGLAMLRACAASSGVVEVDSDLLGDPGPAMVDAAQRVRNAVHGAPAAPPYQAVGSRP